MAELRLFIAVLISDELKSNILKVQEEFKKASGNVKWVDASNFHVTLKFLGGVDEARLDEIYPTLFDAAAGMGPFDITCTGAGAFPSLSRPQTIWIGIKDGVEQLRELAARVEVVMEPLGFPREDRKFKAHITIGRSKDNRGAHELSGIIKDHESDEFGLQRVDRVSLMKSDLRKEGPIYTALREFMLPGA